MQTHVFSVINLEEYSFCYEKPQTGFLRREIKAPTSPSSSSNDESSCRHFKIIKCDHSNESY